MIAGLPSCTATAVQRLEAYSPVQGLGLHGSLDACVYVCAEHVPAARDAITAAGMTAHAMPGSRQGLTCGQVSDYITMQLAAAHAAAEGRPARWNANTPHQHPAWCDLTRCTVAGESGEHRSRQLATTVAPSEPLHARVWLESLPAEDGAACPLESTYVLIDLDQAGDGQRRTFLVGVGQAALLSRLLRRMAELAKAGAR